LPEITGATLLQLYNSVHRRRSSTLPIVALIVAAVLWLISVARANDLAMKSYGLVSILGWTFFVGLVLVVLGFTSELLRTPLRPRYLTAFLILLIVFIFGTASAIEPTGSLQQSFIHTGFIQYILVHGQALNSYDARFSWPGGFSLGALLVAFAGVPNALAFIRWFPLVIELLYLAPLLVIARASGVGRRAAWLGVALFYANNWIFQDYFSPQALNYLFFLIILAVVFANWKPKPASSTPQPRRRVPRRVADVRAWLSRFADVRAWLSRFAAVRALLSRSRSRLEGSDAQARWNSSTTLVTLGLVGAISLASAMSHQLTPYAILLDLAACLVSRRLGRPEVIVVIFLFSVGWLSLGASNYWEGHLSTIFGSIGQLGGTLSANVSKRVTGSASHRAIVDVRILLMVGLYGLGGLGALRRRPETRTLELLAVAPILLLVLQDYGGEGLLRAVLFGLPFVTLLAASAIMPDLVGHGRPLLSVLRLRGHGRTALRVVTVTVVLGLALGTVVVRGGNDTFESFTNGELHAVNFVYNHVTPGQTIGYVAPYLPFGQRDVGVVNQYIAIGVGATLKHVNASSFVKRQVAWIILTRSQASWGVNVAGYAPHWESKLKAALVKRGYKVAATWSTATVLRLAPITSSTKT